MSSCPFNSSPKTNKRYKMLMKLSSFICPIIRFKQVAISSLVLLTIFCTNVSKEKALEHFSKFRQFQFLQPLQGPPTTNSLSVQFSFSQVNNENNCKVSLGTIPCCVNLIIQLIMSCWNDFDFQTREPHIFQ